MSWVSTVSTKANGLIVRFHGRVRAIRGYTSYQRWLRENPEISLDLEVEQTGTTYDTSVRLRMSKKALGHNLVRFQEYNSFLRRKTGGSVNVDALAAFVAILIMTKIPAKITGEMKQPTKEVAPAVKTQEPTVGDSKSEDDDKTWTLGKGSGVECWEDLVS